MKKILKFMQANIPEILLVAGSVSILISYCINFIQTPSQIMKTLITLNAIAAEHVLMSVLSYFMKKEFVKFDIVYMCAWTILTLAALILGVFYLESPAKITLSVIGYIILVVCFSVGTFLGAMYIQTHFPWCKKNNSKNKKV